MGERNKFDYNDVKLPSAAHSAAEAVSREDLLTLFKKLSAAGGAYSKKPQHAAEASLAAVVAFVSAQGHDLDGELSRPLRLLLEHIRNSPKGAPGSIFPATTPGAAVEAPVRSIVNRLKAAGAYAARQLTAQGGTLKANSQEVAAVFAAHKFPMADYYTGDGKPKKAPSVGAISGRIGEWSKKYKTAKNEPGKVFRDLVANPPVGLSRALPKADARYLTLAWLRNELKAGGYDRA